MEKLIESFIVNQNPSSIQLSQFKLLAFDIDGTLLGSSKQLSAYSEGVLARVRKQGIFLTLATGKVLPATRELAGRLRIAQPLILSNGSILQTRQGRLIWQTVLPVDVVSSAIQISRQGKCDLVMYIRNGIYIERMNENIRPIYGNLTSGLYVVDRWENLAGRLAQVNKCLFVDTSDEQNLVRMHAPLRETLGQRADTIRTSPTLLEILPRGITKASGLLMLAEKLNIKMNEVMAFGDYDNDMEMLRTAGLGVAVRGASPACLKAADIVVASADEDGPARFLAELLDKHPSDF